jgi:hypothetical protein
MTYGQTIGFLGQPDTLWWGLLGLTIKGAIWGLLGGAVLGAGLEWEKYGPRTLAGASVLLAGGVWLGWKLINQPKLIYFSNRLDKPRPEIWAGLLFGALAWLAWLAARGGARVSRRFALWGALGGGIGFGLGGALLSVGRSLPVDHRWFEWWKLMEFTFGILLGAGMGWAAWRSRAELAEPRETSGAAPEYGWSVPAAALLCLVVVGGEWQEALRFQFTVTGAALLVLVLFSEELAWQSAITITVCAFAADLAERFTVERRGPVWPGWAFAAAVTLAALVWTHRTRKTAEAILPRGLLFLTFTAVGISWLKSALTPWPWRGHLIVQLTFTGMALLLAWQVRRLTGAAVWRGENVKWQPGRRPSGCDS